MRIRERTPDKPLLLLVFTLLAACSSGEPEAPACSPDLASIQQNIFVRSCAQAGCHGEIEPAAALRLTGENVASELIGVPSSTCADRVRVAPGSPEQSLLYEKIAAATPTCGARMPPSGGLAAEEVECVRQWIAAQVPGDAGPGDAGCLTCGGSQCVDVTSDPAHCGDCGVACPPGGACAAGACSCGGGLTACGSTCADTSVDQANCGACGKACPTGALCSGGQCACPGGLEVCGSACVETILDPANCGGCGNTCSGGKVCNTGVCSATCGSLTQCGAACASTDSSPTHCGACGNTCPLGASCVAGACVCPAGTSACGGQCINTATDPANCGACGKTCAQGTTCEASACACPGGGAVCGAGCVDTQSDPANCGGCGNACAPGQACAAGACSCGSASVSFSGAVQPILTASCASNGCHKGVNPQQGLDLTAANAYQDLVNVAAQQCNDGRKRVLPGQPSESYLIDKMLGVDMCAGTQMPKLNKLPDAQIEAVASWICAGAPNN